METKTNENPGEMLDISVAKSTISEIVAERLQQLIIDNKLKPGDTLPSQRELSQQLGVSRPTIREAFKILEARGLINVNHGLKTTVERATIQSMMSNVSSVLELTDADMFQIFEVREIIETRCAELAAERATPEDLSLIEQHLRKMKEYFNDLDRYVQADWLFHLTLVKSAHNPIINEFIEIIGRMMIRGLRQTVVLGRSFENIHQQIFESIRAKNGAMAKTIVHEHLMNLMRQYKEYLDSRQSK